MFTGIVQGLGQLVSTTHSEGVTRLVVDVPSIQGLARGASIAINGVCLTAVQWESNQVHFDVIDETLRVTNIGKLVPGDSVNVERAARFGDEIGGHALSGHVHGMARVTEVREEGNNLAVRFQPPADLLRYLMPKGYVSLNGCSLTIGPDVSDEFEVYLIPETREVTTFGTVQVGHAINVEIDSQTQAVVDTVERVLHQQGLIQ